MADVRQLLLQVDASVAVAQRNLQSLARQVANDATAMDTSLSRVDKAFSRIGKSAEESAQAFIQGDRAAKSLIASIDPLFAAQHRYDTELERANQLYKTGALSAQEFARVQTGLKTQLDQSVTAFGRVGGASGGVRAGMQQLSFQLGDVAQGFALGTRPMTIFAQQSGQVVQSLQLMSNGGKGFLALLAGPWGIALSAAASLLVLLSSKLHSTSDEVGDLVEKMKKSADQARLNEIANKIWANSLDGVAEAQRKLRGEIEQSIRVEAIQNRQNLKAAEDRLKKQQDELPRLQERLAQARKDLADTEAFARANPDPDQAPAQLAAIQAATKKVQDLQGQVKKLGQDIADSQKTIREAAIPVARDFADAWTDASVAVNRAFDEFRYNVEVTASKNADLAKSLNPVEAAIERARKASDNAVSAGVKVSSTAAKVKDLTQALIQGKIDPDAYTKSVNALAKSLQAAADAAKSAKKGVGEFGKQISFDEAASIARSAGLTVTSARRSTAKQAALYNDPSVNRPGNPVAKPGTSAHEGVNGKWALDIAFAPGLTPEKIKKIYGNQGVSLSAIFKEKGHFHIEGSRSQAAAAENKLAAEQARQVRNDNSFEERSDQLNNQLLAAKMQLIDDTQKQADYAEELVKAEQKRLDNAIQNDVEEGKLTQAQANILKEKNGELAAQKIKNIEVQRQISTLRDQDEAERDGYEFAIELLKGKEALARTANARKEIELQILDIVYEEKKKHLETLKAQADLAGNVAEAARLQAEINRLPARKALEQGSIERNNHGPLQNYLDSLPQSADELNERLQALEVQGIEGLVDALSHVSEGWKAMRDIALRTIQDILAQLIRLQIQRAIFGLLGNAATSSFSGGVPTASVAGATLPSGVTPVGFFASGGFVSGPGSSRSDSVPAMLSNGEFVMNASTVARFGVAFLNGMNTGQITPKDCDCGHKKHGGILGALSLFGGLGGKGLLGSLGGGGASGLLGTSGGLFSTDTAASGLSFLGKILHFADGGPVGRVSIPSMPRMVLPASGGGDNHYNISVAAPNTGNPRKDRATALQQAHLVREAVATVSRKGA